MSVATLYRLDGGKYRAVIPLEMHPAIMEFDVPQTEHDGMISIEFGQDLLPKIEAVLSASSCHIVRPFDDDNLDSEQTVTPPETENVYDRAKRLVRQGASCLVTGPGGVGKSYLMWSIICEALVKGQTLTVSAMTGLAADTLRRGAPDEVLQLLADSQIEIPPVTTFHTTFGAPDCVIKELGKQGSNHDRMVQAWIRSIHQNEEIGERWARQIHIIDEISMMDSQLFDVWQSTMLQMDMDRRPTVVLSGDFCQLPPVSERTRQRSASYCFNAKHWNKLIRDRICVLNKNWRLEGDLEWQNLLDRLRLGRQTEADLEFLKSRSSAHNTPTAEHLRVFCLNSQVEEYNALRNAQLAAAGAAEMVFTPKVTKVVLISNQSGKRNITDAYANFDTAKQLVDRIITCKAGVKGATKLYVGSRVMLTANLSVKDRLVNGAQGKIISFTEGGVKVDFDHIGIKIVSSRAFSDTTVPFLERARNKQDCFEATVNALPLVSAFAITTHKVQGTTLDKCYFNLTDGRRSTVFEPALVYVGLGRVRNSDSIIVDGIDLCWRKIDPPPEVQHFYGQSFGAARPTEAPRIPGVPRGRRNIYDEKVKMSRPSMAVILARARTLRKLHAEQDKERITRQLESQRRATADRLHALRARSVTGSPRTPETPVSAPATPDLADADIL